MVRGIVWFRNDLRLHDNEAFTDAIKNCDEVIPVFIFDERIYRGYTKHGFRKCERHRAQFVIDSIHDLAQSLKAYQLKLYVRVGRPEEELYNLAKQIKSSWIFCNRERTQEEVDVQDALEQSLWSIGQELRFYRGKMLYHTSDLPFPVHHTPEVFSNFRKEVEKFVPVRAPLARPAEDSTRPISVTLDFGKVPEIADFNLAMEEEDQQVFVGGESAGIAQLHEYLWESNRVQSYFDTRNQMLGKDFSSRLAPYLAQGCLSPKYIVRELKAYEEERGGNKSTYWLFFELLWRDFFRLMAKKFGNAIFRKGGISNTPIKESQVEWRSIEKWQEGKTGIPFIDANMRELNRTGYMSNRGRQNVASFFVKDIKQYWVIGAEFFESMLVDYDPCSNYGNWNYVAGVGCDPRENRYFNILSQARKYDPKGEYVRHWLPELASLADNEVHTPSSTGKENYAKPIVPFEIWKS